MKISTVESLRRRAITHSLLIPTTLDNAVEHLKFIQADPIRSPARAQDLILRQRVKNYWAGDLEREYSNLFWERLLILLGLISNSVKSLPLLFGQLTKEF